MITGDRIIKDLVVTIADVQEIKTAHQNDPLWDDIQNRLNEIITLVKRDMLIYGYK